MTVTGKLEQFRPEAMKNACVQAVSDAAKRSLDAGLRDEMKNIVKPWMAQLQQQLMIELSQKLTSTDVALRDNLAKMVKSQVPRFVTKNFMLILQSFRFSQS